MLYSKPATSIDDQLVLLSRRGMQWVDETLVRRWLVTVGYYRLSAYWLPMEVQPTPPAVRSKTFRADTNFESVIDLYTFDRKLRLLVMEAIERIEIALRSRWTHRMALAAGSHAHLDRKNFDCGWDHMDTLAKLSRETRASKEAFVQHYKDRYTDPLLPPIWMATELMTFGQLSMWLSSTADIKLKSGVSRDFGLPDVKTLEGCIQYLSYVRNICAHHGRLWNRKTVKRLPVVNRMADSFVITQAGSQRSVDNRVYSCLAILALLIRHQSPDSSFPRRVALLLEDRPENQLSEMGVPIGWRTRQPWAD